MEIKKWTMTAKTVEPDDKEYQDDVYETIIRRKTNWDRVTLGMVTIASLIFSLYVVTNWVDDRESLSMALNIQKDDNISIRTEMTHMQNRLTKVEKERDESNWRYYEILARNLEKGEILSYISNEFGKIISGIKQLRKNGVQVRDIEDILKREGITVMYDDGGGEMDDS